MAWQPVIQALFRPQSWHERSLSESIPECGRVPKLLQDPDIQAKVLWEGMAIIRPWEAIPAEVLAMEPHIYEDGAIRNGELDEEQKEVLQVCCPFPLPWGNGNSGMHLLCHP